MNLEEELNKELMKIYQRAGKEVGYWGRRFNQSLHRNGGLSTAKCMMKPRPTDRYAGLDRLLKAGRPDLTVESIILQPKFRELFTDDELSVAEGRLRDYNKEINEIHSDRERLFPDELDPGQEYVEGARKQIRVNAYERDVHARKACLDKYGFNCVVCGLNFESKYGSIGKGFIHVHHLKPFSLTDGAYELNPLTDLRPVCPNCHAMLHRQERLLSIEELRALLKPAGY